MTDAQRQAAQQHRAALALIAQGRDAEAAQALAQAVSAGHVPSMALLGAQLLSGQGVAFDAPAGARLILKAAERGDGFACATAAVLYARACSGRSDWPRALDYLQRAAEAGHQPARDQLRLLSGYRAGIDWKKLRRAIDIDAWRQAPAPLALHDDPPVHAAPGLLSAELCDALIARGRRHLRPARIYNELKGGNTPGQMRRHGSAPLFRYTDMDLVTEAVSNRVCALAGLPAANAEALQVLNYQVGEYFAPHVDFLDPAFEGHAATLSQNGQRVYTVLVYLNDDLEGGETEFLRLGLSHRGQKGDALMFRNVDGQGRPDARTLHAGRPPSRGEKWLLSVWILDRATPDSRDPGLMAALAGR
jgi:hypothetical protein